MTKKILQERSSLIFSVLILSHVAETALEPAGHLDNPLAAWMSFKQELHT